MLCQILRLLKVFVVTSIIIHRLSLFLHKNYPVLFCWLTTTRASRHLRRWRSLLELSFWNWNWFKSFVWLSKLTHQSWRSLFNNRWGLYCSCYLLITQNIVTRHTVARKLFTWNCFILARLLLICCYFKLRYSSRCYNWIDYCTRFIGS